MAKNKLEKFLEQLEEARKNGLDMQRWKDDVEKECKDLNTLEDCGVALISFVPDAVKTLRRFLNPPDLYTASSRTLKLYLYAAERVLESVGILSSQPQSYFINNYININKFVDEIKIVVGEFQDKLNKLREQINAGE